MKSSLQEQKGSAMFPDFYRLSNESQSVIYQTTYYNTLA